MQNTRNIRMRRSLRQSNILISHIQDNLKEYCIVSIIFIIGILIGVIFVNNLSESQNQEVDTYINSFLSTLKENGNLKENIVLKNSLVSNISTGILLWILGSTIIGIIFVYFIICFKGFCMGYTISAFLSALGLKNGILLSLSTMLLQNLISIPCIIALGVSGAKLYKSIMQDRRVEKIKLEIIRHTIFSLFILILLIFASILEAYISKNLLLYLIRYI